jgi:hypothetical protein
MVSTVGIDGATHDNRPIRRTGSDCAESGRKSSRLPDEIRNLNAVVISRADHYLGYLFLWHHTCDA